MSVITLAGLNYDDIIPLRDCVARRASLAPLTVGEPHPSLVDTLLRIVVSQRENERV